MKEKEHGEAIATPIQRAAAKQSSTQVTLHCLVALKRVASVSECVPFVRHLPVWNDQVYDRVHAERAWCSHGSGGSPFRCEVFDLLERAPTPREQSQTHRADEWAILKRSLEA